jgi:protein SCO1/2
LSASLLTSTEFHPRFVGLTGSDEQVNEAARAYRIYISKGEASSEEDYLVDHSIFFFLINPDGDFMDFFGRNMTADDIASHCLKVIRTWFKDKSAGRL